MQVQYSLSFSSICCGKYLTLELLNASFCSPVGLWLWLSVLRCWADSGQWVSMKPLKTITLILASFQLIVLVLLLWFSLTAFTVWPGDSWRCLNFSLSSLVLFFTKLVLSLFVQHCKERLSSRSNCLVMFDRDQLCYSRLQFLTSRHMNLYANFGFLWGSNLLVA